MVTLRDPRCGKCGQAVTFTGDRGWHHDGTEPARLKCADDWLPVLWRSDRIPARV